MKRLILFLLTSLIYTSAFTQKSDPSIDSIWCDHLNEIIKCASLDIITPAVGINIDTTVIAPFVPLLSLTPLPSTELVEKKYNKVMYSCYLYSTAKNTSTIATQFSYWHRRLRDCLAIWDETTFANTDMSLSAYPDYFITNSEDETSLRLDVLYDKNAWHVRLRIY